MVPLPSENDSPGFKVKLYMARDDVLLAMDADGKHDAMHWSAYALQKPPPGCLVTL